MKIRGIPRVSGERRKGGNGQDMDEVTENRGGLTAKQRDAAYAMVRGQMPLEDVMKKFGVTEAEFTGWVLDGRFTEYAASLARGYAEAEAAYVWKILQELVRGGGVPAIRLYFDLLGKKTAGTTDHAGSAGTTGLTELRNRIFCGGSDVPDVPDSGS